MHLQGDSWERKVRDLAPHTGIYVHIGRTDAVLTPQRPGCTNFVPGL